MDPIQTCNLLLSYVKNSNLNFSLNESPFSVSISLKKSFIKDKNGTLRVSKIGGIPGISGYDSQSIEEKQILQDENKTLKAALAQHEDENHTLKNTVHVLGIKLEKAKIELTETLSEKKQVVKESEATLSDLDKKKVEIDNLTDLLKKSRTENENQKQEIKSSSKILKNKER